MQGFIKANDRLGYPPREDRLEQVMDLIRNFGMTYSKTLGEGPDPPPGAAAKQPVLKVNEPCQTPLHSAVINGDSDAIERLLDQGTDINVLNGSGGTALHYAVTHKNAKAAELLLRRGADANSASSRGQGSTPLHLSCKHGSEEIVKLLLDGGASVDIRDGDGLTPLHIAAKFGYVQIVECLLCRGASIHSVCTSGFEKEYTPLHFASELESEEAVKLLVNRGANINAREKTGLTPLLIAVKAGQKAVVKFLLQNGAPVDDQDENGKTILHLAVDTKDLSFVKDILSFSPDINDGSNRKSLQSAVYEKESKDIGEALLEYGFKVEPEDRENSQLLHCAVENGYCKIVEDLLKYGADVNSLFKSPSGDSSMALHRAAKKQDEDQVKLLIGYGAHVNGQDYRGKRPILYAVQTGNWNIFKLLLAHGSIVKEDPELFTTAVLSGCIEIVEALLEHPCDINRSDAYGRTALHFTALQDINQGASEMGQIAELLLCKGANVNAQTNSGATTLHFAAEKGSAKIVEALLEYGANVNAKITNPIKPLRISADTSSETYTKLPDTKDLTEGEKDATPLYLAARSGHQDIITSLLKFGADISSTREDGSTALHIAAEHGHSEAVETLLVHGCDVNCKRRGGSTALHVASKHGRVKAVETLLEYGADINITTRKNRTALDYAMGGFLGQLSSRYNSRGYYRSSATLPFKEAVKVLKRHISQMRIVNFYVNERNFRTMSYGHCGGHFVDEVNDFLDETDLVLSYDIPKFEEEIACMKSEKIDNTSITFYDILAKDTSTLATYTRNEDILEVFESGSYLIKFPMYAGFIKSSLIKGLERRELLEKGVEVTKVLFNSFLSQKNLSFPVLCCEQILVYLNNDELRNLVNSCETCSVRVTKKCISK